MVNSQFDVSRRYMLRSLLVAVTFIVTMLVAKYLIKGEGVSGPLAYGLALIPGVVMVGFFWSTGRMIVETEDEFLRMLAVRQQLIAAGFAMAIATAWGTLELFELVPHVEALYILVLLAVGDIVGMIANRIAFGPYGECR